MDAHVTRALESGTHHPIRISWTLPNSELLDCRVRLDLLGRGRPVAEALYGWMPLELLELLLDVVGAVAWVVSVDVSPEGRLHLYGLVIVPRTVTPAELDRRWGATTKDPQPASTLASRTCHPAYRARRGDPATGEKALSGRLWERLVAYDLAMRTSDSTSEGGWEFRSVLLSWLSGHVGRIVCYGLKGADRGRLDRRMPARLAPAIRERAAHEWIVSARGVSVPAYVDAERMLDAGADVDELVDAVSAAPMTDLGELLAARAASVSAEARRAVVSACAGDAEVRSRWCWGCDELLPPIRHASDRDDDGRRRPRLHQPRRDRRTCSTKCRVEVHRAYWAVMPVLGRMVFKGAGGAIVRADP